MKPKRPARIFSTIEFRQEIASLGFCLVIFDDDKTHYLIGTQPVTEAQ